MNVPSHCPLHDYKWRNAAWILAIPIPISIAVSRQIQNYSLPVRYSQIFLGCCPWFDFSHKIASASCK